MNLSYKPFLLQFKHPFGVSSNTRKETPSVFLELKEAGFIGYGEACLPLYLGETVNETMLFFEKAKPLFETISIKAEINDILQKVDALLTGNNAAKAAIDIALHDLMGKVKKQTVTHYFGINEKEGKATSFTIGIDREEVLEQKIKEASEFSILKIKAGTADDKKLIETIRKYSDKPLYVDVNQGWTDKQHVLEMINWMKDKGVVLVEQPMPVAMKEEMRWVNLQSPLLTIADESVKRLSDLESLNGAFSGINIKLMKCTGLCEANKMIDFCRENNLRVLLGCMAESSCATSAMAQLMHKADYIDLDAPLLYKNDPFKGVSYKDGKVCLNDLPGIGAEPVKELLRFSEQ